MEGFFPEVVFTVFGIGIRDTVVSTWITMVVIIGLAAILRKHQPTVLVLLLDFLSETISDVMGYSVEPYLPFLGSLAIFVAFANIISVIPVVTTPTRGLNTPVALAIVVFFSVHYFGMRQQGVLGYLKNLASSIFLLPLEIIGQISRTVSLAIRLFGNVLSTELIVAVVFMLIPLIVPLPVIGLNIFTGLLQAYIFTALAAVYISTGLEPEENQAEISEEESKP